MQLSASVTVNDQLRLCLIYWQPLLILSSGHNGGVVYKWQKKRQLPIFRDVIDGRPKKRVQRSELWKKARVKLWQTEKAEKSTLTDHTGCWITMLLPSEVSKTDMEHMEINLQWFSMKMNLTLGQKKARSALFGAPITPLVLSAAYRH